MSILEKPIYNLLQKEPFYANFLLNCKVSLNNKDVKRAAVSIRKHQIVFYINTDWFSSITLLEQIAILKHEIFHVLLEHCNTRSGGHKNHEAKNYAMDCAINQFISNLPNDCVTLESMERLAKRKLNPKDTWEYYYEQLKNEVENNPNYFSDHDKMDGEGMEWESDSDRAIDRATIRDKIGQATKASAGKIPEELSSFIASYNQPALVNWKQQLRNLISSARCTTTKPTMMKTHRRFDLDQPGRKKDRKLVLGVCTDSSGSISDESYSMFMNEIVSIAKNTTITYLVHADCVVQKVDVIKGGKASGDVLKKRHGNGGTAYSPAIEECMKRKCDAIVYFTDGDPSDIPKNPSVPFIWVIVGNQIPPGGFGRIIRI